MTAQSAPPIARGVGLAAAAAVLFGLTAPALKHATEGVGNLSASALLYLGAALGAGITLAARRRAHVGPLLGPGVMARLGLMTLAGAVLAPVLLVAGLRRTDAATGSLLLVLEAPFTVLLARVFFREYLGRKVLAASALLLAGGALLASHQRHGAYTTSGTLLVVAAALAWATDNVVSRTLADEDPLAVVALKGGGGALLSAAAAAALHESLPPLGHAGQLLLIGALGYGASLRLYLEAQRRIGAARTASVFATAPFFGALTAVALGTPVAGLRFAAGAALMIVGVALHATERHRHSHRHEPIEHDHVHAHDDGHHGHGHDSMPQQPHRHLHRHDELAHEHEHGDDLHHRHRH